MMQQNLVLHRAAQGLGATLRPIVADLCREAERAVVSSYSRIHLQARMDFCRRAGQVTDATRCNRSTCAATPIVVSDGPVGLFLLSKEKVVKRAIRGEEKRSAQWKHASDPSGLSVWSRTGAKCLSRRADVRRSSGAHRAIALSAPVSPVGQAAGPMAWCPPGANVLPRQSRPVGYDGNDICRGGKLIHMTQFNAAASEQFRAGQTRRLQRRHDRSEIPKALKNLTCMAKHRNVGTNGLRGDNSIDG